MAISRDVTQILFNGTEPLKIVYNNTDLTLVKVNMKGSTSSTWAFVKPYVLSIDAGSHSHISVTRTSSPYKYLSFTGSLIDGDIIYYGDVLTISYTTDSGYAINTHTVNGTTFSSGDTFTVSSNISVKTTAQASTSWHTVYSGAASFYGNGILYGITLLLNPSTNQPYQTRVSGYGTETWHEGEQSQDHYFYDQNLPLEFVCGYSGITAFKLSVNGTAIRVSNFYSEDGGTPELSYGSGCVTEVQQYY